MAKYIKADDFMDRLHDEVEMGVSDPYEATENALAMLDEEDVFQARWIPVTERLPEKSGDYIVCADGRGPEPNFFGTRVVVEATYDNKWPPATWEWDAHFGRDEDITDIVTHWMPYPNFPKEV